MSRRTAWRQITVPPKSYEAQGRTRDSISVNNTQRRVLAEIKGGPTLWIRIAADWFGTGVWWFLGWVLLFTAVIGANAVTWRISEPNEKLSTRAYRALDLSVKAFFSGPPEDKPLTATAMWVLRLERLIGLAFFFLLGILVNEWVHG